jgi:hypothetical protein
MGEDTLATFENLEVNSVHVVDAPANLQPFLEVGTEKEEDGMEKQKEALQVIESVLALVSDIAETAVAQKITSMLNDLKGKLGAEGANRGEYYGRYPEPEKAEADKQETKKSIGQVIDDVESAEVDGAVEESKAASLKKALQALQESLVGVDVNDLIHECRSHDISESVKIDSIDPKDGEGFTWDVTVISEGVSDNLFLHKRENLPELAGLCEGAKVYANHVPDNKKPQLPERDIRECVGWLENCRVENGGAKHKIKGKFHIVESARWLRDMVRSAFLKGKTNLVGFSIETRGDWAYANHGGQAVREVLKYNRLYSVDVVNEPSAGGSFDAMVRESRNKQLREELMDIQNLTKEELRKLRPELFEDDKPEVKTEPIAEGTKPEPPPVDPDMVELKKAQCRTIISETKLPAEMQKALEGKLLSGADVSISEVQKKVAEMVAFCGEFLDAKERKAKEDYGDMVTEAGMSPVEKNIERLRNFFAPGRSAMDSFKEIYKDLTGDRHLSFAPNRLTNARLSEAARCQADHYGKMISEGKHKQVPGYADGRQVWQSQWISEITRTNWSALYGDIIHKSVLEWAKVGPIGKWRDEVDMVVSIKKRLEDFEDDAHYQMGGLDVLDIVAEAGPYTEFGGGGLEKTSYTPDKRGNLFTITREMVLGDRIGQIKQIPKQIAIVSYYALWYFVFQTSLNANPNMSYDATALFAVAHNNIGSGPGTEVLSATNLDNAINRMAQQTMPGAPSTFPVGVRPKILMCGPKNRVLAKELVAEDRKVNSSEDSTLSNFYKDYGLTSYIVLENMSAAADNWWLCADPDLWETFVLGFVLGREEPEVITQDDPTVGSMFTNDQMTWKARYEFGGTALRHESWDRGYI